MVWLVTCDLASDLLLRMKDRRLAVAFAMVAPTAALIIAGLCPPTAAADNPVRLGGGSGVAVNGVPCILTTIGHDNKGDLVGLTSAHCGGDGAQVTAQGAGNTVGTVAASDPNLDYAVIKFDAGQVSPVANVEGFVINGLGPRPGPLDRVCVQGIANGCGPTLEVLPPGPDPDTVLLRQCGRETQPGAPVTGNDMLWGMIHGGFPPDTGPCPIHRLVPDAPMPGFPPGSHPVSFIPMFDRPEVVSIDAIVAAINATGGPGTGFVPIPA